MFRRTTILGAVVALLLGAATTPAHAVHFFTGCAQSLQAAPAGSAATVTVQGFAFTDQATTTSVTHITAGDSVTWTWGEIYCHSVTEGLFGARSYGVSQQVPKPTFATATILARPDGSNNSFTHTFAEPGVYQYYCDHHVEAGMKGTVIVDGAAPVPALP